MFTVAWRDIFFRQNLVLPVLSAKVFLKRKTVLAIMLCDSTCLYFFNVV